MLPCRRSSDHGTTLIMTMVTGAAKAAAEFEVRQSRGWCRCSDGGGGGRAGGHDNAKTLRWWEFNLYVSAAAAEVVAAASHLTQLACLSAAPPGVAHKGRCSRCVSRHVCMRVCQCDGSCSDVVFDTSPEKGEDDPSPPLPSCLLSLVIVAAPSNSAFELHIHTFAHAHMRMRPPRACS